MTFLPSPDYGSLLVGCPVNRREWIIERWLEHLHAAAAKAGMAPEVLLLGAEHDETIARARKVGERLAICVRAVDSGEHRSPNLTAGNAERDGWRRWSSARLSHMVHLRNRLLAEVRKREPGLFLSLDSDVLLHEQGLVTMLQTISTTDFSAVGSKTYMTNTADRAPNYALIDETGRLVRPNSEAVRRVDVLMAVKLMTATAYAVDYEFDARGEDIGWSLACARHGLQLGWDGRVTSQHVMNAPR